MAGVEDKLVQCSEGACAWFTALQEAAKLIQEADITDRRPRSNDRGTTKSTALFQCGREGCQSRFAGEAVIQRGAMHMARIDYNRGNHPTDCPLKASDAISIYRPTPK